MIHNQLHRYDPQAGVDVPDPGKREHGFQPFGEDGLTFGDILDLINPLQHIPFLSSVYRKITGDAIDPAIRIAGGALFGGPIGAAVATVTVAVGEVRKDLALRTPKPQTEQQYEMPVKLAAMVSKPRRSIVETAATDRPKHTNTVDGEIRTKALELGHDPGRTIRRGSWVLDHAYGPNVETLSERDSFYRVDVAV